MNTGLIFLFLFDNINHIKVYIINRLSKAQKST